MNYLSILSKFIHAKTVKQQHFKVFIEHLIYILFREINHTLQIPYNLLWLEHLKISAGISYLTSLPFFIIERAVATIMISEYEKYRSGIIMMGVVLIQLVVGVFLTTLFFIKPNIIQYFFLLGIVLAILQTFVGFRVFTCLH